LITSIHIDCATRWRAHARVAGSAARGAGLDAVPAAAAAAAAWAAAGAAAAAAQGGGAAGRSAWWDGGGCWALQVERVWPGGACRGVCRACLDGGARSTDVPCRSAWWWAMGGGGARLARWGVPWWCVGPWVRVVCRPCLVAVGAAPTHGGRLHNRLSVPPEDEIVLKTQALTMGAVGAAARKEHP